MKKILLSILTITAFSFCANAQIVNIPDANFKAYLVGNTAINTNADTEIQLSEATAFSGAITCQGLLISNLTGIEAFTALDNLTCNNNQLTSLDITQNTSLTWLDCSNNSLSSLDLTQNTALIVLNCYVNQLTNLDVSQNTALIGLSCHSNNLLTNLNVANGNNTNFSSFNATNNPNLTCIEVDNVAYSTTNWTNIDAGASFSTNCSVGIGELSEQKINVYPNPVKNQITIDTKEHIKNITITNDSGKGIKTVVSSNNTVDVSNLVKGIYFLQVQTENGIANSKFIKE